MSLYWLLFASLAVAGSLAYNGFVKVGSVQTNPFGFVCVMTGATLAIQILCGLIAKYAFKMDVTQGINSDATKFAVLAGAGAALINVSYFLALRYGSVVTSQIFWTAGSLLGMAIIAALFFGEVVTPTKITGIVLCIIAVFLITRPA